MSTEAIIQALIGAWFSFSLAIVIVLMKVMINKIEKLGDSVAKLAVNSVTHSVCGTRMKDHSEGIKENRSEIAKHSEHIATINATLGIN